MSTKSDLIVKTILSHLESTGQLDLLGEVVDALKNTTHYKNSKNRVVVTSATVLDTSELKSIKSYLVKSLNGEDFELKELLDPTLLAGFTLQINDTFIDASVLGKINMVQNQLTTKE